MTTATKERPILFSGPMVLAILEGRKTQTRRVVKGRWAQIHSEKHGVPPAVETWWWGVEYVRGQKQYITPYAATGERLWVREGWRWFGRSRRDGVEGGFSYRADHKQRKFDEFDDPDLRWKDFKVATANENYGWRPSIHMPRWACRIILEITEVRVQRIHEISDADVVAEGVEQIHIDKNRKFFHKNDVHGLAFGELWNSINGKRAPWSSNPWVWAITFKRLP